MATERTPIATPPSRKWIEDGPTNRIATLLMGGLLIFLWFERGPDHPIFGLLVASWTLVLGVVIAVPIMLRIPARWFHVSTGERILHEILGVAVFGWLLHRIGWNRFVIPTRGFNGTKATLLNLELSARGAASAHGACFLLHLLLAALALLSGHRWGALWILLPGVVVHLYPVLLQRSILLRLRPLLARHSVAAM